VTDGTWVEVTGKLARSDGSLEGTWVEFDGSEAVIVSDLSLLADGAPVEIAPTKAERKVDNEPPATAHGSTKP
jgi:hypothetical protein